MTYEELESTISDKTSADILTLEDLKKYYDILEKGRPREWWVEIKFNEVPNFELRDNGNSYFLGIPVIVDKDVPKDECWFKNNKGEITKIKIGKI